MQQLLDPESTPVTLQNPISAEMSVMRTSLWQGLVTALLYNVNRQQTRVRFFETGLRFSINGASATDEAAPAFKQEPVIAGLIYGARHHESWIEKSSNVDFYDIKGDVEALLSITKNASQFTFEAAIHSALHPGQTAAIKLAGNIVGYVGALHPTLQKSLDLPQTAYLFEITQAALADSSFPSFTPLSRFPEVRRDIAVVIDQKLAVSTLQAKVKEIAGELLTHLKVFDVYVGKGIDSERKSVALGLTFQHLSRTLTDDEITSSVNNVVVALKAEFNAELR
jgi:phenylalanyl-tRNA synthetase beta chain